MVLRHFDLREQPFGVTPDPRFLYPSATHREALACLLYGIQSGVGFVTLTAMPGMGKTTLLFELLRRIDARAKTVFLFQNLTTPVDLLRALLIDLGVQNVKTNLVDLQAQLNEVVISQDAAGKRLVVVIDEAHNLNESVLEAIRMLSNFETPSHKLMQIVLSGQPQLVDKLASPQLLQLRQRVSIFGRLKPLSPSDCTTYIRHRLRVSGNSSTEPIFSDDALAMISHYSEGVPRNINNICFNAMSLGCALRRKRITPELIREVLTDLGVDCGLHTEPTAISTKHRKNQLPRGKAISTGASSNMRILFGAVAACATVLMFGRPGIQDYRALPLDIPVPPDTDKGSFPIGQQVETTPQATLRLHKS